MKGGGHNETGRHAPKSEQQMAVEIKENVKRLIYALDSIPDEYRSAVIRSTAFVGQVTDRVWADNLTPDA